MLAPATVDTIPEHLREARRKYVHATLRQLTPQHDLLRCSPDLPVGTCAEAHPRLAARRVADSVPIPPTYWVGDATVPLALQSLIISG